MNELLYEETSFPIDYKRQKVFMVMCKVFSALFFINAAFFAFLALWTEISAILFPLFVAVWSVIMGVLFIFIKKKFYNCYDFIFVSGEVRIIKVVNTKKRRKMIIFDSKDVFQVGRYGSETYEIMIKSPDIKRIFAPTNKTEYEEKPKYYIGVVVDGVKYAVILECTEKLLKYILHYAGKPVLEKGFK